MSHIEMVLFCCTLSELNVPYSGLVNSVVQLCKFCNILRTVTSLAFVVFFLLNVDYVTKTYFKCTMQHTIFNVKSLHINKNCHGRWHISPKVFWKMGLVKLVEGVLLRKWNRDQLYFFLSMHTWMTCQVRTPPMKYWTDSN